MKKKKKKPSFDLTYKEITLWFVLFLFMSASLFTLGVFIGKNTGPALFTFDNHQEQTDIFEIAAIDKSPGDFDGDVLEFLGWLSEKGDDISSFIDESKKKIIAVKPDPGIKKNKLPKGVAIHVAAFKNRQKAYRLIERLRKKRYPVYLSMGTNSRHNVRIGCFKTMAEARQMVKRLDKDNITSMIVKP